MAKLTYYEVLKVTKPSDDAPETEEVVFTTPHRSEALVVKDRLNADLSPQERTVHEFRFAQRSVYGSESSELVN